jgi:hypothetical protein
MATEELSLPGTVYYEIILKYLLYSIIIYEYTY